MADTSQDETPRQSQTQKHGMLGRVPSWFWPILITTLVNQIVPALLGAVTAVLILLKAGLLRLAQLPASAIIALIVIEIVLVALVFALAIIYAVQTAMYLVIYAIDALFKRETAKRPFWLAPVDAYSGWVLSAVMNLAERFGVDDDQDAARSTSKDNASSNQHTQPSEPMTTPDAPQ